MSTATSTATTTPYYAVRPYCPTCILWFSSSAELKTHLTSDPVHTPFACNPCNLGFASLLELQKHHLLDKKCLDVANSGRERREGFCEICVVWCEGGKEGLEKHLREGKCFGGEEEADPKGKGKGKEKEGTSKIKTPEGSVCGDGDGDSDSDSVKLEFDTDTETERGDADSDMDSDDETVYTEEDGYDSDDFGFHDYSGGYGL